jgi:hypothetical protein
MAEDGTGTDREEARAARERHREAQRVTAFNWIRAHWTGSQSCPVCKNSEWRVGNIVEARLYGEPASVGALYPYVPYTCTTCALTLFFNAIDMGLFAGELGDDGP